MSVHAHRTEADIDTEQEPARVSVSVVVPAYNEAAIITESLTELHAYMEAQSDRYEWEIVVVNDGSTDETGILAERFAAAHAAVRVLHHRLNFRLGQALRYAFSNCTSDYIVTLDSDLSYAPDHVTRLVETMRETAARIVIASPYASGGKVTSVPWRRRVMSRWANRMLGRAAIGNLTTLTGMVRVYDRRFLRTLNLKAMDNEINLEIVYKAQLLRARVVEIPAHLDWSKQTRPGATRRSTIRVRRSTLSAIFLAFIFRPFVFFIAPGLVLLAASLWMILWVCIRVGQFFAAGSGSFDPRFSQALSDAFDKAPYTFVVGGITLLVGIQLLSLGIISLQAKRYFEELFHLGSSILRRADPGMGDPAGLDGTDGRDVNLVVDGAVPPVAVLGAGIAGLVAASELRARGIPAVVYEAGPKVAGLATSHQDPDGFTYDTGAHFITNRLANRVGVGDRCRLVRHYGETVWLEGSTYGYPFGLLRVPRFVRSAITTKLGRSPELRAPANAADWFRSEYGRALADEVALPLVEEWSGAPASQLSTAVGDKLPGGIASTLALKLAARVTRRAIAIGYCRERPQSPRVWHVYPDGGVATLCRKLADDLGPAVHLESPVEQILVEDGTARGVRVAGREVEASAVISTAPVHVLPKLVAGTDALERFAAFRYRPMVFVNIRFRGRGLLPDVVTWTPEDRFPFFRLTETTLSMPWLAPAGKTLVTVDIGAEVGDAHWTMDDEALGKLCVDHLAPILPDAARRYLGCRVLRTPIAYPVFHLDYEPDRRTLERTTGVERLLSIGRNGEFAHILMEDVYWRTHDRVAALAAELGSGH